MNSSQNIPNLLTTLKPQDLSALTSTEIEEMNKLIAITGNGCLEFSGICQILDYQWDEFGCDNQNLDWDNIGKFYNHPVWLLNGMFIEQDPLSMQLRQSLVDWIVDRKDCINSVLDYGGGFGTIARAIAAQSSNLLVDVYEPHPHNLAIFKSTEYSNIKFINSIDRQYDCLISTDVLEHVADPLRVFASAIESVKLNGYLVISNHFAPTIKCHLPATFHLVYTFDYFAKIMGLSVLGTCPGTYATIYQKVVKKPLNWELINKLAAISSGLYPLLRAIARTKNKLSQVISQSL
ncbi:methyltransferase domain-containing protein [Chamaesiphon sp. GL140_3_metabinner_50]|uniref:class I SAM-dependent methyltransferase n=1 Tax=Chamaesiphon sp. GL140_3_metabinner_50 TaxID=2970812 RepID=UPI0025D15249|nr:methyltransferase domain-containing protein [Chamaesiphon sp. GL140_3_metabinner_50]